MLDVLNGANGLPMPDFKEADRKCLRCTNGHMMYEFAYCVCVDCANEATQESLFPRFEPK